MLILQGPLLLHRRILKWRYKKKTMFFSFVNILYIMSLVLVINRLISYKLIPLPDSLLFSIILFYSEIINGSIVYGVQV